MLALIISDYRFMKKLYSFNCFFLLNWLFWQCLFVIVYSNCFACWKLFLTMTSPKNDSEICWLRVRFNWSAESSISKRTVKSFQGISYKNDSPGERIVLHGVQWLRTLPINTRLLKNYVWRFFTPFFQFFFSSCVCLYYDCYKSAFLKTFHLMKFLLPAFSFTINSFDGCAFAAMNLDSTVCGSVRMESEYIV